MNLSEYLDFDDPDGPKLIGHRIWLYDLLYEHLLRGLNADDLLVRFPTLNAAKIYACLLYFSENREPTLSWFDEERRQRDAAFAAGVRGQGDRWDKIRRRARDQIKQGA